MTTPSENLVKNLTFCVFDLETTGPNHDQDKIIEIGLVKIQNKKIVEEKDFLINPQIRIPEFIQKLTSISNNDVKNSPTIEKVIDEILDFMGDSILVAHNISFDVPFFNAVLKKLDKLPLKNNSLCTNLMTKYLIPSLINSNLNYMSSVFGIAHTKAHRALDDARAAAQLLLKYLDFFIEKDISKINHLYYPRNRFELDRKNFRSESGNDEVIRQLKKNKIPYLLAIKGKNGVILFSLPCKGNGEEIDFIKSHLTKLEWAMVTIKLYGPFLEALIHFAHISSKLPPETLKEILKFLQIEESDQKLPDFFIANHLIPGQYVVFPVSALNTRSQLVFTYPAQRKKLHQFLISKGLKIDRKKIKQTAFSSDVESLVKSYLLSATDIFLINKEIPKNNADGFFALFNKFVRKNPNSGLFPGEHI
ncbi:MAG: 3'-5' exonuclease [Deltaproteobacteria bacterium]|nr:MAG: 3'-5' exonuclease [Deltaproteobacteria bacterium]